MKRCPSCAAACWDSHRHCPSCGSDVTEVAPDDGDPFIGTTLVGKYQLIELIGVGAMGRVYRALHLGLDTQVAVKLLNNDIATDPVTAKRFQNEARAASRLHHPNAIAILDFGQAASGTLYLVMELLRGRTLAQLVRDEGPVPAPRLADLLGQALAALDEAHAAGIIHRDFKPDNIFVETLRSGREHVKVLDFGIAKLQSETDTQLTSAGLVCGTPDYMSPEQIRGLDLDARSDIYSAGVVMYEALTGKRLFDGITALIDVLQAHLHRAPLPPSQRRPELHIPAAIEAVCLRALAKDVATRYGNATELRAALEIAGRSSDDRCAACGAQRQSGRFCAECGTPFPAAALERDPYASLVISPNASLPTQHDASFELPPAPSSARVAAVAAIGVPGTLPFCGRDPLLARLGTLQRGGVLLVGEPGSGKSSVALAWAERRAAIARQVVVVEADGPGLVAPLSPLRRAIGAVLGLDEQPEQGAINTALAEHVEDRAGIAALFGAERGRSPLPIDVRRRECRAAALAVLQRADVDLVFDDLHLYDGVTRDILGELVATRSAPTLLLTSTRADVLRSSPLVEIIELPHLEAQALAALGIGPQIIARAGGLPHAVETALRAAAEGASEPTTAARLQVLSPGLRLAVELLAVAGAPLPRAQLESAGVDGAVDAVVAELAQRGFLRSARAPYRLSSPTVRREIYESIDIERRRSMHARLGAILERSGADLYFVAYHALSSGDGEPVRLPELGEGPMLSPGDSVAALERAGVAARSAFDDAGATRALRAAMERCRIALMLGLGDERQLMQIELKLGVVLRYGNDLPGAEVVLREAAQLAQERREAWAIVEARRGLARVSTMSSKPERSREELNLAAQAALQLGDAAILCEVYLDLGEVMLRLGLPIEAAQELDEGILLVTQGDGPEAESGPSMLPRLIAKLAEVKLSLSENADAQRLIRHALRLAEAVGAPLDRARAHTVAALVASAQGNLAEAASQRRRAVEELRALGDRRSTAEQLLALADEPTSSTVRKSDRESWLHEAERLSQQVDWPEGGERSRSRLRELM